LYLISVVSQSSYDNAFSHDNLYGHALELLTRYRTKPPESGPERIHLDLGCGYGRIAEPLTAALGLRYVGVDADAVALASLHERGFETHELVLNASDCLLDALRAVAGNRVIASISMLDTLEHLRDGDAVLGCLHAIASEHCTLTVLSVPNVAHRDIGFKLAFGSFSYTPVGLLDHTHLRFFSADYLEAVLKHAGFYRVDRSDVRVSVSDQHFPVTHPALNRSTSLHRFLRTLRAEAEPNDDVNQFVWLCVSGPKMAEKPFVTTTDHSRPFLSIVTRTQGKRAQSLVEMFTCLAGQSVTDFEVLVLGHRLSHARQLLVERILEDNPAWLRARTRLILVDKGNRTHPLNVGFGAARGDYISILDDDDIVMAHWVETFKTLAKEKPGCLLRATVVRQNVVNTTVLGKVGVRAVGTLEKKYPSEFDFLEHLRENHTPPLSLAFPRGAFHDLNVRFDEELTTTEDWDYMMRVATITGTTSSPKITSVYHWWVSDQSSRSDHPTHEWVINHQRILQKLDRDLVLFPEGTPYAIRSLLNERDNLRKQLRSCYEDERQRQNPERLVKRTLHENEQLQFSAEAARRAEETKRAQLIHLLCSNSWRWSAPLRLLGRLTGGRAISIANAQLLASSQLEEAIRQVYASTSWRVTAPLRKLDEAIRAVVKRVFYRRS
jgi:SAM-dependent methyltransferase